MIDIDPAVRLVLENIETIVGTEGGSLEVIDASTNHLSVKYTEGYNEECPECVPTHEMVQRMIVASLKIHAPHVHQLNLL